MENWAQQQDPAQLRHRGPRTTWSRLTLCILLMCVSGVTQTWASETDDLTFHEVIRGLERRSFDYSAPGLPINGRIHAFRIHPSEHRIRVVHTPKGQTATVQELAKKNHLVFAINASFFDPKGTPLGLLIDSGVKIQNIRRVDWGVFYVLNDGKAYIAHTRDFVDRADINVAVQAGPRLVVDGKALKLKPQIARRSAVCINARDQVIFVATEAGILLQDFAILLARPEGQGGLGCVSALNLDGGSSTQGVLRLPSAPWHLHGGAEIPVAMGFSLETKQSKQR